MYETQVVISPSRHADPRLSLAELEVAGVDIAALQLRREIKRAVAEASALIQRPDPCYELPAVAHHPGEGDSVLSSPAGYDGDLATAPIDWQRSAQHDDGLDITIGGRRLR